MKCTHLSAVVEGTTAVTLPNSFQAWLYMPSHVNQEVSIQLFQSPCVCVCVCVCVARGSIAAVLQPDGYFCILFIQLRCTLHILYIWRSRI